MLRVDVQRRKAKNQYNSLHNTISLGLRRLIANEIWHEPTGLCFIFSWCLMLCSGCRFLCSVCFIVLLT